MKNIWENENEFFHQKNKKYIKITTVFHKKKIKTMIYNKHHNILYL